MRVARRRRTERFYACGALEQFRAARSTRTLDGAMSLPLPPPLPLTKDQVRIRSRVAAIGVTAAWLVIFMLVLGNIFIDLVEYNAAFRAIAVAAFFGTVPLWIVAWLEYFRERPAEYSLVWAFLLMTGPVFGPLLFYYRVWRARYGSRAI